MHRAIAAALRAAEATPTPLPTTQIDPELVNPGPWGFVVIAFLALAVIVLIWDMLRRIRRGRFRAEIREQLDAEEAAQADAAVDGTEAGDEDAGLRG